ncbi:MAG: VTT domain-containing protein [Phycisphaerales bacterium]
METLFQDLWKLIAEPGNLRENLALMVQHSGFLTYAGLFLIVFCETGLVVTPFLPGDSLLFVAGFVCATVEHSAAEQHVAPAVSGPVMALILIAAAVLGDGVNYHVGRWLGPVAFSGRFRWLKREHLERTHAFFEKHGGRAIVLARFVPIVRTFAPFVAGIGSMRYTQFLAYNVLGAVLWVGLLMGAGYWLGGLDWVQRHFEKVVIGIVVVSLLPLVWEWWKARTLQRSQANP